MSSVRTRRQAAAREETPSKVRPAASEPQQVVLNGNGSAHLTDATAGFEEENIFIFWPNIIGYVRIVLAIASLYYMPLHPRTCSFLYSVSCLLDALDGYAARYFEQSTRFGAVLDMGLVSVDFASHYMHMYATLAMAGAETSHKNVDKSRSLLLNLYYTNKAVLFITCALNELFFIAVYLLSFSSPLLAPALLKTPAAEPLQQGAQVNSSLLRQIFASPYSAAALELARANKMDSTIPWVLAGVSFPVMLFKQVLNVIQMVKASKWLAEGDIRARREKGLPRKKQGKAA